MPRERSLLERLQQPDQAGRTIHDDTRLRVDSVLANLRRLLNSRHGIARTRGDYGIPDLTEVVHSFPEAIGQMRTAIRTAIERYEPRLRRVNVRSVETPDDPLSLRFEITAELIGSDERASVWFETRIDPSGEVELHT
ncbi:MAG: type VI secretion system baseplate subunit TssE [Candidatus Eisenbacteria bacterium]